jgi:hypothetical protein
MCALACFPAPPRAPEFEFFSRLPLFQTVLSDPYDALLSCSKSDELYDNEEDTHGALEEKERPRHDPYTTTMNHQMTTDPKSTRAPQQQHLALSSLLFAASVITIMMIAIARTARS